MEVLTPKQERFIQELLVDDNGTQAAIRAGYYPNSAAFMSSVNLAKPKIAKALAEARAKRSEATRIDAEYVLRRLAEIDQMDVLDILAEDGSIKPISQWPKIWRSFVCSIEVIEKFDKQDEERKVTLLKKVKWPDKLKNLELLGRHVGIGAFKENVTVTVPIQLNFGPGDAKL